MATLDDILLKAKSMAQSAGEKTGDFIELTKLRLDAAQKEKEIVAALEGLGRLVYDSSKAETDVDELVWACIQQVDELTDEVELLREKINLYKGRVACAVCRVYNPEDAVYCKKCGTKM